MRFLKCYFIIFLFIGNVNAQQNQAKDSISVDTLNTASDEKSKFKFFGLTQFTFNQAYFENWVSGGENSMTG
ncbi:MAG: hypothetical protein CMC22_06920, partial [Flavobacteriaceae bacterium]|nr:hypothetical protein [Flavobacteriaceae bacterium]